MADRTLTNLIPILHESLDQVSREQIGFIPAVSRDAAAARAAVGQTVYSPVTGAKSGYDITPAVSSPDSGDSAVGNVGVSITKARAVAIRFNGEQSAALGMNRETILRDEITQAMRTLSNEIEGDLAGLYKYASRAHGTAGTAPFGSTPKLADAWSLKDLMDAHGAPSMGRTLVINGAAEGNLAALTNLTQVGDAGDSSFLRRGILQDIAGFGFRKSAQIATHTKGTGTGYLVDLTAGYVAGDTTIHVDTGAGTIVTGDILGFQGDNNKYLVATGFGGDGDGDIVLAPPGLLGTLANDKTLTIGANYAANMAFSQNAIQLAVRLPMLPDGGDSADDRYTVSDPVSGLTFEVALYRQYRQVLYEVSIAWGVKAIKPEHLVVLLG